MHTLKDFGVKRYVGKLRDGTRVVLFYHPNMPVYTRVLFRAGSRYDPIGKEGLAHFSEHMLFRKTRNFSSQYKLTSYIEDVGGGFNAFTGLNHMGVEVGLADKSDYSKAANFIGEVLFNQDIRTNNFDIEKKIVLQEYFDIVSNQESYIWKLFVDLIFQGSLKGRPTIGYENSIRGIEVADIKDFYKERIPDVEKVVVVAGDIGLKEIEDNFDKTFIKDTSNITDVDITEIPLVRKESIKIKRYPGSKQVNFLIGFRTVPFLHKDLIPLEVLSYLISSGMSSRLMQKVRSEKGLVYRISADNSSSSDSGCWLVDASTSIENKQQALDLVTKEFGDIFNGKFTKEELVIAKNKVLKIQVRRLQSSKSWVNFHFEGELDGPDEYFSLDKYLNAVEKVTIEDLRRVGKEYFKPESWYLAVCGDLTKNDIKVNY